MIDVSRGLSRCQEIDGTRELGGVEFVGRGSGAVATYEREHDSCQVVVTARAVDVGEAQSVRGDATDRVGKRQANAGHLLHVPERRGTQVVRGNPLFGHGSTFTRWRAGGPPNSCELTLERGRGGLALAQAFRQVGTTRQCQSAAELSTRARRLGARI